MGFLSWLRGKFKTTRRTDPNDARVGSQVGQFWLESRLHPLGTSQVYLGRPVAGGQPPSVHVRLLDSRVPEEKMRFRRQTECLMHLKHPGFPKAISFGEGYVITEAVPGQLLSQSAKLEWRRVAEVGVQVAEALSYLHRQGLLHLHLTAAKIWLSPGRSCIQDLSGVQRKDTPMLTVSSTPQGNPETRAPEQLDGKKAGPAADQYALGVILRALATEGAHPILQRMLEPDPRQRFADMDAAAAALRASL